MAEAKTRNWVFTINNHTDKDVPRKWTGVAYCVWQEERGASGTPHLQGYVVFTNARAMAGLKKVHSTAHWAVRMGSHAQAKEYCQKEETRVSGPWTIGEYNEPDGAGQGKRNDLDRMKEMIDSGSSLTKLWDEHFGEMVKYSRAMREYMILKGGNKRNWLTVTTVYWGPTGTGKTKTVQERAGPNAYWMKQPGAGQSVFFDGYDGEEDVVIDEFYGWIPWSVMLKMLDRYPLLVDTKGGAVQFAPKRIWITSNQEPSTWYKNINDVSPLLRRLSGDNGCVIYLGPPIPEEQRLPRVRSSAPVGSVARLGREDDRLERLAEFAESDGYMPGEKRPIIEICDEHPGNQEDDIEILNSDQSYDGGDSRRAAGLSAPQQ
ncbi:Rep [uncultured virus]|uniref:ATP-dependent helicase Rep n=1 Tax=uncultured virus TaxID=340016 RepID=A0A2K9LS75_9VIRU|nr:Rep [uncultured virus]